MLAEMTKAAKFAIQASREGQQVMYGV